MLLVAQRPTSTRPLNGPAKISQATDWWQTLVDLRKNSDGFIRQPTTNRYIWSTWSWFLSIFLNQLMSSQTWFGQHMEFNWCWVRCPQFLGLLPPLGWFLTTGLCLVPVFHQILFDICFELICKYWWRFRICNVQSSGDWLRLKASNWKKKKLVTGGFCQSQNCRFCKGSDCSFSST